MKLGRYVEYAGKQPCTLIINNNLKKKENG